MAQRIAKRVLLVGWDAADWKIMSPMLDAGQLPALQSLVDRGVMGNLSTLDPAFSPMLWTSIATGHTADRHGIVHFVQPSADGVSAEPVLGSSRRVKALWNILSQEGLRSNVVGWWPSHPAEPIRGAMVSNFFHPATAPAHEAWVPPPGTVHPPELEPDLLAYRVHPAELTGNHLLPFVPDLSEVDQLRDPRPATIAKIIADASSVHAAATYLMETTDWDLTAVYYDAIDHFSHAFMRYHPPQMANVSDQDFRLYRHVVEAGYRFHDMMLERLLALAGEDCTVILLSDHGFHSDHLRPEVVPRHVPSGAATEHRSFGALCMAGPGIRRDERVYGAGLLNIAPTVLTLLGLPVGEDMAAPPLLQAFDDPPEVETIPSWEEREGEDGQLASSFVADPWSQQEALRQLVALGYVDPEATKPGGAEAARRDSAFNLGRVFASTGRPDDAVREFEAAYSVSSPHRDYYALSLIGAYLAAGHLEDAQRVAAESEAEGTRFPVALTLSRADIASRSGDVEASLALIDSLPESALKTPEVWLRRANLLLRLERLDEAGAAFARVLQLDPDNARGHHGVALVSLARKQYGAAADAALEAVSRLYHFPSAHYHLGVALLRLGWAERAAEALQVAVRQAPAHAEAHHWLARTYQNYLGDRDAAQRHYKTYRSILAARERAR